MNKTQQVQQAMVQAMKAGQPERKMTLSLLLSALKLAAKEKREPLTPEEENSIILKEIKQTKETRDGAPASLPELREECERQLAVLGEFAPQMMSEAQINAAIDQVLGALSLASHTPQDKGNIMKNLMPLVKGKADGGLVNRLVALRME